MPLVELVEHVRTAAGEEWFHLPIGAIIERHSHSELLKLRGDMQQKYAREDPRVKKIRAAVVASRKAGRGATRGSISEQVGKKPAEPKPVVAPPRPVVTHTPRMKKTKGIPSDMRQFNAEDALFVMQPPLNGLDAVTSVRGMPGVDAPYRLTIRSTVPQDPNKMVDTYKEMTSAWKRQPPEARKLLHHIGWGIQPKPSYGSETALGANYPGQGLIKLSPRIFYATSRGQASSVLHKGKNPFDPNWWVRVPEDTKPAELIVSHEAGHAIMHEVFGQNYPDTHEFWRGFAKAIGAPGPPNAVRDEESIKDWVSFNRTRIINAVSKYGSRNPAEMMAELWSEYSLSPTPRDAARFAGDYVMQQMRQKRGISDDNRAA